MLGPSPHGASQVAKLRSILCTIGPYWYGRVKRLLFSSAMYPRLLPTGMTGQLKSALEKLFAAFEDEALQELATQFEISEHPAAAQIPQSTDVYLLVRGKVRLQRMALKQPPVPFFSVHLALSYSCNLPCHRPTVPCE